MEQGLTFIELLLVIAIIAILSASATPFLSRFVLLTQFDSARDKIASTVRKSQAYAMDSKNGATWGICKSGTVIRLYSGSCASPTISEDFSIPGSVSVSGFSDTTFNKRGEPSAAGTITVSTSLESATIQLNTAGGLDW